MQLFNQRGSYICLMSILQYQQCKLRNSTLLELHCHLLRVLKKKPHALYAPQRMNPTWPTVLSCSSERCFCPGRGLPRALRLLCFDSDVTALPPPLDECGWAAARCHLSPNEARTSGISAVNDPLTAEQIQLSPGFLNRHQVYYRRRGEGRRARETG